MKIRKAKTKILFKLIDINWFFTKQMERMKNSDFEDLDGDLDGESKN